MRRERQLISLIVVTCIFNSLCTYSNDCSYSGVKFSIDEDYAISLTLEEPKIFNKTNLSTMDANIIVRHNNDKLVYYTLKVVSVDYESVTFNLNNTSQNKGKNVNYKYPMAEWRPFSIEFVLGSNDPDIINLTFFDNSTKIGGRVKVTRSNDGTLELELNDDIPGITGGSGRQKISYIHFGHETWKLGIKIRLLYTCGD